MVDMDIEKLIDAASSDKVGKNAQSIMSMLKEANVALVEVQKITNILKQMGLLPLIVRGIGAKMKIDPETPLKTDSGITPASEAHAVLLKTINSFNDAQLLEFSKAISNASVQSQSGKPVDK